MSTDDFRLQVSLPNSFRLITEIRKASFIFSEKRLNCERRGEDFVSSTLRWVRVMIRYSDGQSEDWSQWKRLMPVWELWGRHSFTHTNTLNNPYVVCKAVNHSMPSEQQEGNSQQVRELAWRKTGWQSSFPMHTQTSGIGDDGSRHIQAWLMIPQLRVLIAFW